ncbi:HTH-like domain-containing protein [Novosphingobium sp.]|uniref:HTH-like domain-containing protein n=1 Tax=Novosphingobium sp. TaxID=1874826 RepID=UPI003B516992
MNELVDELKRVCAAASNGNRVVTMHLFAIEHAAKLKGVSLKDLASRAGIGESFATELSKGVRLANYVQITSRPE